tara:strand:+ start:3937 stop:4521 length:585 start_codon:yes stop_codon:yes gene_type:complete
MKTDTVEDISFLLYLAPVVFYGVNTVLDLMVVGLTFQESFLSVTRNPIWLIGSLVAISLALILHLRETNENDRNSIVVMHSKRMRMIGIVVLLISLGEAIMVSDAESNALGLFITGRLPILFTAVMFLQSAFIQIPFSAKPDNKKFTMSVISSILILSSPAVYYLTDFVGLPFVVNLTASIALIIFGSLLFTRS